MDETTENRIKKLWLPPSPIKLVEYHMLIAERARELLRERITRGWGRLKPSDAIHLASAESVGATHLHTYNTSDFSQWGPVIGVQVEEPVSTTPQML